MGETSPESKALYVLYVSLANCCAVNVAGVVGGVCDERSHYRAEIQRSHQAGLCELQSACYLAMIGIPLDCPGVCGVCVYVSVCLGGKVHGFVAQVRRGDPPERVFIIS